MWGHTAISMVGDYTYNNKHTYVTNIKMHIRKINWKTFTPC